MKPFVVCIAVVMLQYQISNVQASEPVGESTVAPGLLAKQGEAVITQDMFSARAAMIPAELRQEVLRNPGRFREILGNMLLNAQLAAKARAAGFDKQTMAASRMQLAAEGELALVWLHHYVETQPDADYEQLAQEYYLLNSDEYLTAETIDVSHILIADKERSEPEARELAINLHQQVTQDPSLFDSLVTEFSEDSSAVSNEGKITKVKRGDMVGPFEDVAFALENKEISAPVKTEFGYHIIRLDDRVAPKVQGFEQIKGELIVLEMERHETRLRRNYVDGLIANEIEVSEAAMDELISRLLADTEQAGDGVDSE